MVPVRTNRYSHPVQIRNLLHELELLPVKNHFDSYNFFFCLFFYGKVSSSLLSDRQTPGIIDVL